MMKKEKAEDAGRRESERYVAEVEQQQITMFSVVGPVVDLVSRMLKLFAPCCIVACLLFYF